MLASKYLVSILKRKKKQNHMQETLKPLLIRSTDTVVVIKDQATHGEAEDFYNSRIGIIIELLQAI